MWGKSRRGRAGFGEQELGGGGRGKGAPHTTCTQHDKEAQQNATRHWALERPRPRREVGCPSPTEGQGSRAGQPGGAAGARAYGAHSRILASSASSSSSSSRLLAMYSSKAVWRASSSESRESMGSRGGMAARGRCSCCSLLPPRRSVAGRGFLCSLGLGSLVSAARGKGTGLRQNQAWLVVWSGAKDRKIFVHPRFLRELENPPGQKSFSGKHRSAYYIHSYMNVHVPPGLCSGLVLPRTLVICIRLVLLL